jgi:hypothetical protein
VSQRPPPPRRPTRPRREDLPEPPLPDGVEPDLPREVYREIRQHAHKADTRKVALALEEGTQLVEEGEPEAALRFLAWAADKAPRSATIRETAGIARYQAEDYRGALTDLQAYRRFSGSQDQNHLIADCLRATGRPPAKVAEYVRQMQPEEVGRDRWIEGLIVWASALGDAGDVSAGRAVLRAALDHREPGPPADHHLRLWYVAADLAERDGDAAAAKELFDGIAAEDADFFDVKQRLAQL